jgi:hypothetical protein
MSFSEKTNWWVCAALRDLENEFQQDCSSFGSQAEPGAGPRGLASVSVWWWRRWDGSLSWGRTGGRTGRTLPGLDARFEDRIWRTTPDGTVQCRF